MALKPERAEFKCTFYPILAQGPEGKPFNLCEPSDAAAAKWDSRTYLRGSPQGRIGLGMRNGSTVPVRGMPGEKE